MDKWEEASKYPLCLVCPALQKSHAFMSPHISLDLFEVKLLTSIKDPTLSRAMGMSKAL